MCIYIVCMALYGSIRIYTHYVYIDIHLYTYLLTYLSAYPFTHPPQEHAGIHVITYKASSRSASSSMFFTATGSVLVMSIRCTQCVLAGYPKSASLATQPACVGGGVG